MSLACPVTRVTGTQGGSCLAEGSGRGWRGEREGACLCPLQTGKSSPLGDPQTVEPWGNVRWGGGSGSVGGCVWSRGSLDTSLSVSTVFLGILAKREASSPGGRSHPDSQAGLRPFGLRRQRTPGESPDCSHIPYPGSWGPALPPPGVPPPTWAVLRAGSSARAWQTWQEKGSNPPPRSHPALHPPAVAPPPSPPFGRAQPLSRPQPVWSSRHGLSCHRNSDFPGVWSRPRQGGRWAVSVATVPKAAGFGIPYPPTASGGHGHCRTKAWQILA